MKSRYLVMFLVLTYTMGVRGVDVDLNGSDIDIVFIYGVKANRIHPVNRFDTFRGTFTKDMVLDPPITFDLKLREEDLERIAMKIDQIRIYEYPTYYAPPSRGASVTPYTTYDLRIYVDGVPVKQVLMDTDVWSDDDKTRDLCSLFSLIIEIIESSEAYKNSPKPSSGYC